MNEKLSIAHRMMYIVVHYPLVLCLAQAVIIHIRYV